MVPIPLNLSAEVKQFFKDHQEHPWEAVKENPRYLYRYLKSALRDTSLWRWLCDSTLQKAYIAFEELIEQNKFTDEQQQKIDRLVEGSSYWIKHRFCFYVNSYSCPPTAFYVSKKCFNVLALDSKKPVIDSESITFENLPNFLEIAFEYNLECLMELCLNHIQKELQSPFDFLGEEKDILISCKEFEFFDVKIFCVNINTAGLIEKYLGCFPKEKLVLHFLPTAVTGAENIARLFEIFGENVETINLLRMPCSPTDQFLDSLLTRCTHTKRLFVESEEISSEGIKKIGQLKDLEQIRLLRVKALEKVPSFDGLIQLKEIKITGSSLVTLPTLSHSQDLEVVNLDNNPYLTLVEGIGNLPYLKELSLKNCPSLNLEGQGSILIDWLQKDFSKARKLGSALLPDATLSEALFNILDKHPPHEQMRILAFLSHLKFSEAGEKWFNYLILVESSEVILVIDILEAAGFPNEKEKLGLRYEDVMLLVNKSLQAPSFVQYKAAQQCNISVSLRTVDWVRSFEENCVSMNALCQSNDSPEEIKALTEFLNTETGVQTLVKHKNKIHQLSGLSYFIQALYSPNDRENTRFYPITAATSLENSGEAFLQLTCAYYHPERNPKELLEALAFAITHRNPEYFEVVYFGQSGLDRDGLTRDVLFRLAFSLIELRVFDWERAFEGSQDIDPCFKNLGVLFRWLLNQKRDKFPLGVTFPTGFFEGILLFSHYERCLAFDKISKKTIKGIMRVIPETILGSNLIEFVKWNGIEKKQKQLNFILSLRELVRPDVAQKIGEIKDEEGLINDLSRLQVIVEGMYTQFKIEQVRRLHKIAESIDCNESDWGFLQSFTANNMAQHLQGRFDASEMKKILLLDELPVNFQAWISEWISTKSADELKNFLKFVTGTPARPYRSILIRISSENKLQVPRASTCGLVLEIPQSLKLFTDPGMDEKAGLFALLNYCCMGEEENFSD